MSIDKYRKQIDEIDSQLLTLLLSRLDVVEKIGACKREKGLPIENKQREEAVLSSKLKRLRTKEEAQAVYSFFNSIMELSKDYQRSFYNIYLIGMPYSGKSTLLNKLSRHTNKPCVDMDRLIEKSTGKSIPQLFAQGEEVFRRAESEALCQIAANGSSIVATGGGVLTVEGNIDLIKQSGYTILCDRSLENLKEAYQSDMGTRPLIKSIEDLEILYFERFKTYREQADLIINPDDDTAIHRIIEFTGEKGIEL